MDINLDLRPLLATGDEAVLDELVQACVAHGAAITNRGVPVLPLLLDAQRFAALNAIAQARPPGFYQVLRASHGYNEGHRLWRRLVAQVAGMEAVFSPLLAWQELVTVMASELDVTRIVADWQFAPDTPGAGCTLEVPWEFPEAPVARTLADHFQRVGGAAAKPLAPETMTRIAAQVSYQGRLPGTPITPASRACADGYLSGLSHGPRYREGTRPASFYDIRAVIPAKELVLVFYATGGYEVVRNRAIAQGEGGPLFALDTAPSPPAWATRAWF